MSYARTDIIARLVKTVETLDASALRLAAEIDDLDVPLIVQLNDFGMSIDDLTTLRRTLEKHGITVIAVDTCDAHPDGLVIYGRAFRARAAADALSRLPPDRLNRRTDDA